MPLQMRDYDEIRKDAREAMAQRRLSIRHIQRETGISQVTLSGFFSGRLRTQDGIVIKLCLYLGVPWSRNDKNEAVHA